LVKTKRIERAIFIALFFFLEPGFTPSPRALLSTILFSIRISIYLCYYSQLRSTEAGHSL
jgi:hypothetical protein